MNDTATTTSSGNSSSSGRRWGGLLIEADFDRWLELSELYRDNTGVTCLQSMVQLTGDDSLPSLLRAAGAPADIDFVSIDIDGCDYHIWKSLMGSEYRPRVVCIEFNPTIPHNIHFVQEADFRVYKGTSIRALLELGILMGYAMVATTTFNAFFIRIDLVPLLAKVEGFDMTHINDLDKLHVPSMVTHMYQLYDGEIRYSGVQKMLWHRVAMNPQQLQVIARRNRIFPFAPKQAFRCAMDAVADILTALLVAIEAKGVVTCTSVDRATVLERLQDLCSIARKYIAMSHLTALIVEVLDCAASVLLTHDNTKSDTTLVTSALSMITSLYYERLEADREHSDTYLYSLVHLETINANHGSVNTTATGNDDGVLKLSQLCRSRDEPLEALYYCVTSRRSTKALEKELLRIRSKATTLIQGIIKQWGTQANLITSTTTTSSANTATSTNTATTATTAITATTATTVSHCLSWYATNVVCLTMGIILGLVVRRRG